MKLVFATNVSIYYNRPFSLKLLIRKFIKCCF